MKPEWEKVKVKDREYSFEMLPAELASYLWPQVLEAFGESAASIIDLLGIDLGDNNIDDVISGKSDISEILPNIDLSVVQGALAKFFAGVNPAKTKPIIDGVIQSIFVTGPEDMTGHRCTYNDFTGRIADLYKVIIFALRYQFWDFFDVSLLSGSKAQEATDA